MRSHTLPIFLLSCFLVILLFFTGQMGWLTFMTNSIQSAIFQTRIQSVYTTKKTDELSFLKKENARLQRMLTKMNQLQQDNAALRDQFATTAISSKTLLPVSIVSMPSVIPNVTFPETLIINAGTKEQVKTGSTIVVQDEAVGIVTNASDYYALVQLVSNKNSSFPVKTSLNGAVGIARGQGNGEIIMGNVLLSDTLTVGESVVTSGNQDISGKGYPPHLIVGTIVSIDKNPSSLFQQARILPLVRFNHLTRVFVIRY